MESSPKAQHTEMLKKPGCIPVKGYHGAFHKKNFFLQNTCLKKEIEETSNKAINIASEW